MPKPEHKAVFIAIDDGMFSQIHADLLKIQNVKFSEVRIASAVVADDSKAPPQVLGPTCDMVFFVIDASKDISHQIEKLKGLKLPYDEKRETGIIMHRSDIKDDQVTIRPKNFMDLQLDETGITKSKQPHSTYDEILVDTRKLIKHIYSLPHLPKKNIFLTDHTGEGSRKICDEIPKMEYRLNLPALVAAFKKIYKALYDGQTSWLKSANFADSLNGLSDSKAEIAIKNHIAQNRQSRTAEAWFLAERHLGEDISAKNDDLFRWIYKYAFRNSSWFFKQSRTTGDRLFKARTVVDKIDQQSTRIDSSNDKTRSGKIRLALG